MRHRKTVKKFGRVRNQRKALFYTLASNLILNEKIRTTEARAKALRKYAEPLISKAKRGDQASLRKLMSILSERAAKKLFRELAPKLKDRKGGDLRITKIGRRPSDGAPLVFIEFVK